MHGEIRNENKTLMGKSEGNRPLGDLNVDGRRILTWILRKTDVMWPGFIRFRRGVNGRALVSTVFHLRGS
jgi:hypothetical protein